nr:hypothetical protein [uncultured Oscillibacter sp.]
MLYSGITIYPEFSLSIYLGDLLVVLPVFAVFVAAQIYLSRREKWWPGLILPAAWLLWTIIAIAPEMVQLWTEGDFFDIFEISGMGILVLLLENIPNLILLAIYAACHLHRRRKEKRQLKKTQIDDL